MHLIIPPEVLAYFLPLAMLSIAVGVAGVLITGGVKLLDSNTQMLVRRMDTLRCQITNRFDRFNETLNQKQRF